MKELLNNAKEELKRVDHLIYVSLKYTRTVDVIQNVIDRLISSFDFVAEALLEKALEDGKIKEIPQAPRLKCEILENIYEEDEKVLLALKEYMLLRAILRAEFEKENEYRRHVGMIVNIEGQEIKVHIDKVTEYYKAAKDFIEYLENTYDD